MDANLGDEVNAALRRLSVTPETSSPDVSVDENITQPETSVEAWPPSLPDLYLRYVLPHLLSSHCHADNERAHQHVTTAMAKLTPTERECLQNKPDRFQAWVAARWTEVGALIPRPSPRVLDNNDIYPLCVCYSRKHKLKNCPYLKPPISQLSRREKEELRRVALFSTEPEEKMAASWKILKLGAKYHGQFIVRLGPNNRGCPSGGQVFHPTITPVVIDVEEEE